MLTPRIPRLIPRLTASRHGFLARSTALSWPWNSDRSLAAPGAMPPSFADLALGLVDRTKPVIRTWRKEPLQREDTPVVLPQAGTQGATTRSGVEQPALDHRCREDDDGSPGRSVTDLAKNPIQREDDASGTASPVVPAQAGTQGATTQSATGQPPLDPRFRADDDEGGASAQNPLQRERPPHLPLRPPGNHASGGEGRGEVGKPQPAEPHVSAATPPAQNPIHPDRTGPLRNGNPRGNPNLAPRCGARTRRTGCPCQAPAMRNGRCRMHGGKSTGPRTEEGRARIRAARTRHGLYSAEGRAFQRNITGLLSRNRQLLRLASQPGPVDAEALRHLLPPDFGKHLLHRETPPAARPTAPAPDSQNPVHRETRAPVANRPTYQAEPIRTAPHADARWKNLMQRDNSPAPGSSGLPAALPAASTAPPPALPARRPILLARPKPHAP